MQLIIPRSCMWMENEETPSAWHPTISILYQSTMAVTLELIRLLEARAGEGPQHCH